MSKSWDGLPIVNVCPTTIRPGWLLPVITKHNAFKKCTEKNNHWYSHCAIRVSEFLRKWWHHCVMYVKWQWHFLERCGKCHECPSCGTSKSYYIIRSSVDGAMLQKGQRELTCMKDWRPRMEHSTNTMTYKVLYDTISILVCYVTAMTRHTKSQS